MRVVLPVFCLFLKFRQNCFFELRSLWIGRERTLNVFYIINPLCWKIQSWKHTWKGNFFRYPSPKGYLGATFFVTWLTVYSVSNLSCIWYGNLLKSSLNKHFVHIFMAKSWLGPVGIGSSKSNDVISKILLILATDNFLGTLTDNLSGFVTETHLLSLPFWWNGSVKNAISFSFKSLTKIRIWMSMTPHDGRWR